MPIKTHSPGIPAFLIAACALAQPASAAENPGAHEHGSAQLQMALEGSQVDLMFTSPAYNLAGFEHDARTDEEKDQLASIRDWLETNPLVDTSAGACRVTAATVELGGDSGHQGKHDHHDEHHHDDKHHHDKHDHGDKHDHESTHRDYEVAQQLECDTTTSSQAFNSPLMSRFPEIQELSIEWVSASGQGSTRITSSDASFIPGK